MLDKLKVFNVAIIGAGLIGNKRAKALLQIPNVKIKAVCDKNIELAQAFKKMDDNICVYGSYDDLLNSKVQKELGLNLAIVATTNNLLTPITLQALNLGMDVLVEKPAARNLKEFEAIFNYIEMNPQRKVKIGFNHRFHPAIMRAKELIEAGELGRPEELMFLRGRYGHGGRVGYNREWRANVDISGGGELLDQGVHLIDLARWFLGTGGREGTATGANFSKVNGSAHTYFWNMEVDDNAFLDLKTESGQTAFLHVSSTEWKNLFSLEIYGKKGKIHIEGLGGSYGVERCSYYRMLDEMGPPETMIWEYPREDNSWREEIVSFLNAIERNYPNEKINGNVYDAYEALQIVDKIYRESGYVNN
ncbi:MAG: Gfo/Idh/MocA family oxidoreductase [Oligoflexia bacterium]|nr:Gfo/Idh/MocA family oxidoreductase [Oligoflexia bacterium]